MAKIIIHRPRNFVGFARKFKVFLDGKLIGKVPNGQTAEFEIPAGSHELTCKQGFSESTDKCNFSIAENETKAFNMAYSKPLLMFLSIFAIVIISVCLKDWLTLKFDLSHLYSAMIYVVFLIIFFILFKVMKLFHIKIERI